MNDNLKLVHLYFAYVSKQEILAFQIVAVVQVVLLPLQPRRQGWAWGRVNQDVVLLGTKVMANLQAP